MTGAAQPAAGRGRESPTFGDLLAEATAMLAAAGVPAARREALTLLGAVARTSPGALWLRQHEEAGVAVAADLATVLTRRAAGAPAAYAVGSAAFRSLELAIDERVLIPRPETEGLVQGVLDWCAARGRWGGAVDVGTGSGCIALSLAVEGHFDHIVAIDLSERALALARRNAEVVAPPTPVEFLLGDLLWPLGGRQADVIVANPPYVTAEEWAGLEPGVRQHEPRLALVGGPDGLRHTAALLRLAGSRLHEGGLLAMELDSRRVRETLALAAAHGWTARVEQDLFGRERYLFAHREA